MPSMRSSEPGGERRAKLVVLWVLFALAVALAAGAVVAAGWRSTIPRALDARVVAEDWLLEHRAGVDDVFVLTLDDGRRIHVDEAVATVVAVGDRLEKSRGSRVLSVNGEGELLRWSTDTRRIGIASAVVLALMMAMALFETGRGGEGVE